MIGLLAVEFTALAAQHIRAEQWWRLNRPVAPDAIRVELQRRLPIVATTPRIGLRVTNVRLKSVRRIHIPRSRYHLYFHATGAIDRALW
jgi:hypothetical protein